MSMYKQNTFLFHVVLLSLLILAGCSDSNPAAPPTGQAHAVNWFSQHPTEANADLASCQSCHNNDFTGSGLAVSCFSCHPSGPPFTMHPASWTVPVVDHQSFATQVSWTSCAADTCHGASLHGGSMSAPSCFSASFLNGSGTTNTCHAGGPPVPHTAGVAYADPAEHGAAARPNQIYCRNCHGRPDNIFDGGFIADPLILNIPAGNCASCHSAAKAHPTNWQGSNDADPSYVSSHQGLNTPSCALCHLTTGTGAGPLPAAPSCFVDDHLNADGSTTACHGANGPGAPHSLDGSYLLGINHGSDPMGLNLTAFPNGMLDCQRCHGYPGVVNSQFNRGINSAGGQGCEGCHNDGTAHPSVSSIMDPAREGNHWYDGSISHNSVPVAFYVRGCSPCHGATLTEGFPALGPACWGPASSCHVASPLANATGCVSCHALPPTGNGLVAVGNVRPNRSGKHGLTEHSAGINGIDLPLRETCAVCHGASNGPGNVNHFDQDIDPNILNNADVIMTGDGAGIIRTQAAENTTCNGTCHGGDHSNKMWY